MNRILCLFVLTLLSAPIAAQPYVIGGLGQAQYGTGSSSGYTIGAGYQLNRHLALEAAYNSLPSGTFSDTPTLAGNVRTFTSTAWEGTSGSVSAIGLFPFGKGEAFALVGKVSAYKVSSDSTTTVVVNDLTAGTVTSSSSSSSASDWTPGVGLGLQWSTGGFSVRGLLERIKENDAMPDHMTLFSLNAIWAFK